MIKTAFVFDYYHDDSTEIKDAIAELNAVAGLEPGKSLNIKVALASSGLTAADLREQYNLFIIDYGGIGIHNPASANAQIWAVCNYAENHPSCLVVIWTGFTADIYRDQIEDQFAGVSNIVCRYGDSVYENLNGSPAFLSVFRNWFSDEIASATVDYDDSAVDKE